MCCFASIARAVVCRSCRTLGLMIDDPLPLDWRELQHGVCLLLNDVGLSAQTEVALRTPRGTVTVDVYAVDESSVDRTRYVVECKNWGNAVPQTVVHAFVTVMQETGANIGYLVSKHGLQSGAVDYTSATNVVGLTYAELQAKYFPAWWKKVFCKTLADEGESLFKYVTRVPVEHVQALSPPEKEHLQVLRKKHELLATAVGAALAGQRSGLVLLPAPAAMQELRERYAGGALAPQSASTQYFRPLLRELAERVARATEEFTLVFGKDVFVSGRADR
jgi:Restriction endonuclease